MMDIRNVVNDLFTHFQNSWTVHHAFNYSPLFKVGDLFMIYF